MILQDISERRQVKQALDWAYRELEELVRERTRELERTNRQLFAEIDERVRAEQGLSLAAKVFETATEGILITDSEVRIVKCNNAFMNISGYTQEEVFGRNPNLLYSGRHDRAFYQQMWEGLKEKGTWTGEIWNRRKNGEIYPQRLAITAVWNGSNELTHYVGIFSDITELKETEKRLERMVYFDALTQLPNRVLFRDRLQHELDKKSRSDAKLAVLFIDLDRFKHVNDSLGHSAGDQLLLEVAERLRICLRKYDTVARLGGDEFAAIITGLKDGREAAPVARKIIEAMKSVFHLNGHEVFIGASIGISVFPGDGEEMETLTKHADIAMYKAKESGRGTFKFYEEAINAGLQNHLQLESAVRSGLRNGEFTVHYQPKVSLSSGRIIGMESLVRWFPSNGPMISPAHFIPVAEEIDFASGRAGAAGLLSSGGPVAGGGTEYTHGGESLRVAVSEERSGGRGAGGAGSERPAGGSVGVGDHRKHGHGQCGKVHRTHASSESVGGDARGGRLWHRIFVAQLSEAIPDRYLEDRSVVRAGSGSDAGGAGHRIGDHLHGQSPESGNRRRRGRDGRADADSSGEGMS
ncbi:MAG: diguanylate cyclase [Magnetococcales bacterium]|nr:diguanylate cyclase [Magnetococcales bacterium]